MKSTLEKETQANFVDNVIENLRSECFEFPAQYDDTFETDAGYNPKLTQIAKNYVANFEKFSRKGQGLLLYGSFGCGKTFASHQIANALIDKERRVRVSTFEGLHALYRDGRSSGSFFKRLASYDLVILDDLGAEHQNKQMRGFVFEIINTLYEARTPFIITTAIPPEALKNPTDEEAARVYDRIFERCPRPIDASTSNIRYKIVRETFSDYGQTLGLTT